MNALVVIFRGCLMNGVHAGRTTNSTKKFEKLCKKCLTNSTTCAKLKKFAANAAERTVPCKLNNVKTN